MLSKKAEIENRCAAALLDNSKVGDSYTISIGKNTEMKLFKEKQEELNNKVISTSDGTVKLKGKFNDYTGPVDFQVNLEINVTSFPICS